MEFKINLLAAVDIVNVKYILFTVKYFAYL
jgi:hypothetical protein